MSRQLVAAAVTAIGAAMTTTAATVMWGPAALFIAGVAVMAFGLFAIDDGEKTP